jgi:hypothetical protein
LAVKRARVSFRPTKSGALWGAGAPQKKLKDLGLKNKVIILMFYLHLIFFGLKKGKKRGLGVDELGLFG